MVKTSPRPVAETADGEGGKLEKNSGISIKKTKETKTFCKLGITISLPSHC